MAIAYRLSKTRFTAGLQCHKLLWWRVHEPDAPELVVGAAQQAVFDQGTRVGEVARTYVPDGELVDLPHDAFAQRITRTQELLFYRVPAIYEATFSGGDVYAAVDILEREGGRFHLIEVKSSTKLKPEHIPDVAIQLHALRAAGLDVAHAELMHLNRECAYPNLEDLFVRENVTAEAEALQPALPELIAGQLRMLAGGCPDVAIGEHCRTPYECPFLGRCWPEVPEHHVSTLHRVRNGGADLVAQGYETIAELPPGGLTAIQEHQRLAVTTGRVVVEPGLERALRVFREPLAFLDFETVMLAIPVWDGCHPYDQVPVQFSCDRSGPDGTIAHHEWLADGPGDPRPELARALVAACRGARTVVAYNAQFERRCIEMLADAVPDLADDLLDIAERLADPLPIVREQVYHPDFHGSFSLKSVLPALVPTPAPEPPASDLVSVERALRACSPSPDVGPGLAPALESPASTEPCHSEAQRAEESPRSVTALVHALESPVSSLVGAGLAPALESPASVVVGPGPAPALESPDPTKPCHSEARRAEESPRSVTARAPALVSTGPTNVGAGLAPALESDVIARSPAKPGDVAISSSPQGLPNLATGPGRPFHPPSPYDALETADGATASLALERLMFRADTTTADERQHLRDALLRYCALDTMSMVRLVESLRQLPE